MSLLVALAWQISIHVAAAAGPVMIVVLVFGPNWLLLLPLLGWTMVALDDHSPAQAIAGALLGATVPASVFSPLRRSGGGHVLVRKGTCTTPGETHMLSRGPRRLIGRVGTDVPTREQGRAMSSKSTTTRGTSSTPRTGHSG